ncbi:MAG: GNAT family N-acetyltransferase [Clostridia bacterium]|nr:GNAT family N-acetyltransferase [Clostridia bacterium]
MNTLYTERLVLRPFRESDAAAMYRNWTWDERVARYCRWYPHKSVEDTQAYLSICMKEEYCWAITLKGTNEPVGSIDLVGVNSFGIPEIGYVLAHDYWGRGIMTEAVKAVIGELFANGFEVVGACHAVGNPASGRVMEKCGMKYFATVTMQKKFGSDEKCEVRCYRIYK